MTGGEVFPIRLQRGLRPILLLFGVRTRSAWVRLAGDRVIARFGFYRAETTLANVARWDITGPYRWWRAVGVRASLGKAELTFGGSAHAGVALHLREPIRVARLNVRDLYLTVEDVEAFGRELTARGIPGKDRRPSRS